MVTFNRVWHAGFLHRFKYCGISGRIFGLIPSFLSNRWVQVVLDAKSSQKHSINAAVPQSSILDPNFFLLYMIEIFLC